MKKQTNEKTIPAFPNWYPYNELLLQGKISAKTRTWRWSHTGLTLLYTSTRTAPDVAKVHGLDPKTAPRGILVGVGELLPVRKNTRDERRQIEKEFANNRRGGVGVMAGIYRYEFSNLWRFETPIPFTPPKGSVSILRIPTVLVAKALKDIGISL